MKKVWLFTYPRSGNSMLSSMMLASLSNVSFESIYKNTIDEPRLLRELGELGVKPSAEPNWKIIKTHRWNHVPDSDKVIWLVRDGRDAMCSYWFYHLTMHKDTKFKNPIDYWKSLDGDPLNGVISQWHNHIRAVKDLVYKRDSLVLKYEDIVNNPSGEISKVGSFLSEKVDVNKLSSVTFDRLNSVNGQFFRKGKIGGFKELPEKAVEYLEREMSSVLKMTGYGQKQK